MIICSMEKADFLSLETTNQQLCEKWIWLARIASAALICFTRDFYSYWLIRMAWYCNREEACSKPAFGYKKASLVYVRVRASRATQEICGT